MVDSLGCKSANRLGSPRTVDLGQPLDDVLYPAVLQAQNGEVDHAERLLAWSDPRREPRAPGDASASPRRQWAGCVGIVKWKRGTWTDGCGRMAAGLPGQLFLGTVMKHIRERNGWAGSKPVQTVSDMHTQCWRSSASGSLHTVPVSRGRTATSSIPTASTPETWIWRCSTAPMTRGVHTSRSSWVMRSCTYAPRKVARQSGPGRTLLAGPATHTLSDWSERHADESPSVPRPAMATRHACSIVNLPRVKSHQPRGCQRFWVLM